MQSPYRPSRRRLLAGLSMLVPGVLTAQSVPRPNATAAELTGFTPDGQRIELNALRNRVVMIFFWSAECSVCLNKMPELRANVAGWRGEAFTLLGVNMDGNRDLFTRYEKLLQPLVPADLRFQSVWGRDLDYRDNLGHVTHLPTTVLVDKQGQVVERYPGRIPPAAWNRIADLL